MHSLLRGKAGLAACAILLALAGCGLAACNDGSLPTPTQVAATPTVIMELPTGVAQQPLDGHAETPTATPIPPTEVPTEGPTATPTVDASQPLKGHIIGLDPGHGPREDLGAVLVDPDSGKLILSEDELNLDVSLRLRDILEARGATVVLTRDKPDTFTVPWTPDTNGDGKNGTEADDLQHRIDILNNAKAEVFLSIHANSHANPAKRGGVQALYCATTDCAFPEQNKRLGKITLDHLEAALANTGVPVKKRELRSDMWSDTPDGPMNHLYMLGPAKPPGHPRAISMPGIVIEALYVTSPDEAAQLKLSPVRQAIARAYADALEEYLGVGSR